MTTLYTSQTKRRPISDRARHSETQTLSEMEELYWFAMALTGDPEFAAKLVANAGNLTSTARGIFRD